MRFIGRLETQRRIFIVMKVVLNRIVRFRDQRNGVDDRNNDIF